MEKFRLIQSKIRFDFFLVCGILRLIKGDRNPERKRVATNARKVTNK